MDADPFVIFFSSPFPYFLLSLSFSTYSGHLRAFPLLVYSLAYLERNIIHYYLTHSNQIPKTLQSSPFNSSKRSGYYTYHLLWHTVAYSLKARIVESQQPAVTRQRPINNNRRMIFSGQSVPMAGHETVECVIPSLGNNSTATVEQCFLRGPLWDVISGTS
jgi:hypothetical protein